MARINWTSEAELWLKDIYDYIKQDNPKAAEKVVSGIYQRAQILKEFPRIGHAYRKKSTEDIRILIYGHYRIAYLIKSDDSIDILGVFHGAMDIKRYLF